MAALLQKLHGNFQRESRLALVSAVMILLSTMDRTVIVAAAAQRKSSAEYAAGAGSGWLPLFKGGLCVRKYNARVTFDVAEKSCVDGGGHLATICDDEDNIILSAFAHVNYDYQKEDDTWIGYRRKKDDRTKWEWTSGRSCTYTSWGWRQPDDSGTEDCAHYWSSYSSSYWLWNDNSCAREMFYMCEVPCNITSESQ